MDENSMRNSIRRRGQQNTYELADGAASLAQEAKQIVEKPQLQPKEHPHPEVGYVVEAIEAIITDFRITLSRQLRRSNFVLYMVEILPPFVVAAVALAAGYFFVT